MDEIRISRLGRGRAAIIRLGHFQAPVFVVVTVYAQQFPVAAVGRVVVVVVVPVMHGEFSESLAGEFTCTFSTDMREEF